MLCDPVNFDISVLTERQLAELIEYHDRRYWELHDPEISDIRYDELIRALTAMNPEHPVLQRLYGPSGAADKIIHRTPMLSLDKAYSLDAVMEWAEKTVRNQDEILLVQPKYDGISALYEYADGVWVLSTRGDGTEGENISDKLPLVELEAPGYTGKPDRPARGELVIRDDDFASLYRHIIKQGGGTYKNQRNAVAGIMGLKDITVMLAQHAKITLADYSLISFEVPVRDLRRRWDSLLAELDKLPYPQDGVVIKLADTEFAASLGNTAHHPRGAIAYKFNNRSGTSRLLGVEWSFGKNCLTPVALLEPVELSGTTIRRATLHNAQNVIDTGIKAGDTVTVERAGDVIPHIAAVIPNPDESMRKDVMITECPGCGAELIRRGPELCCPNPDCFETLLRRLEAAVRNLGIENLGEPTLRKLMKTGPHPVRKLRDIFNLTLTDILRLDGFAEKSAANLLEEIDKAGKVPDYKLLAALNIPGIGPNIARMLLTGRTLGDLREMTGEQFAAISGIGPERAQALVRELKNQSEILDEMLEAVTVSHDTGSDNDKPSVCFTGKMPRKRSYYAQLSEQRGYRFTDEVNSGLSLLVAADPSENSGKLAKARKYGIKIISLSEFMNEADQDIPDKTKSGQGLLF